MLTEEKVTQYNSLKSELSEAETELKRINGFLNREPDNRDNGRAINQGKIFVKFAGTACMLPIGIFNAELNKRKKELEDRITAINDELTAL